MNVLILAAGYATRLYPLTQNKAKPLLEVAGKPMLEWVVDALATVDGIETIYVVTNNKFAQDFEDWASGYSKRHFGKRFKIINDGSTDDSNKLGAIGDIQMVINTEKLERDDLLVVAGDNLFSDPLNSFVEFAKGHPAAVATYDVGDLEQIKKYNNVKTDPNGRITHFEEKPKEPASTMTAIACYYYSKAVIPLFNTYIAEGNNPDQPGRFVEWLYVRDSFYTYPIKGTWFDIGSKETLEEANVLFQKFAK
jgi:glucose-1-phosphate thymidylyltransferase